MKRRYLPALSMLIAALISCIMSVVQQIDTLTALATLFLVMICFYIIGLVARFVLNRLFVEKPKEEDDLEEKSDEGVDDKEK